MLTMPRRSHFSLVPTWGLSMSPDVSARCSLSEGDLDDPWEALVPAQSGCLRRRRTSLGELSSPVPRVLQVSRVGH